MPGIGDTSCVYRCVHPLPSPSALMALRSPAMGSGNLYVPKSGLSPNPMAAIGPGHGPQITCAYTSGCVSVPLCSPFGAMWALAWHWESQRSLSTVIGAAGPAGDEGQSTVPAAAGCADGPVPRSWGSARTPLWCGASAPITPRHGAHLPPTQTPVPGSRERSAVGVAVGHVLPTPCSELPVSSMRFARWAAVE